MTRDRVDIQRVESKDPDLVASLRVMPPLKYPDADPESYKAKERSEWTLGNLERTCIELRAAGGWDDSLVKIGYCDGGSIECEILAGPGPDVLPWGWVPAHGAPPTRPSVVVVPPAAISVRAQRFAFGIGALLAVDLLARLIGWVFS